MTNHDHSHGLSGLAFGSTTWDQMTKYSQPYQAKAEPSTLERIVAERKEARERERIEFLYQAYDNANFDDAADGTVLRFTWTPEGSTTAYRYAAITAAHRWYVTGRESPNGLANEDFIAWMIGKDIEATEIEWMEPV